MEEVLPNPEQHFLLLIQYLQDKICLTEHHLNTICVWDAMFSCGILTVYSHVPLKSILFF